MSRPVNMQERGLNYRRIERLGKASCEYLVEAIKAEEQGYIGRALDLHKLSVACINKQRQIHQEMNR